MRSGRLQRMVKVMARLSEATIPLPPLEKGVRGARELLPPGDHSGKRGAGFAACL